MKYQLLIIATVLLSACTTKIKQANKRGLEHMKQNHYEQAIAEFSRIINEDAEWYPAYYNRSVSYANTHQYKEALDDLNYILTNFPDHANSYFNRGVIYENLGLYANAIKDYSETIKLRPDFILAYHYRGIARFRMNDLDGALEDYTKALDMGKNMEMDVVKAKEFGLNSSALYFNRGVVFQKKGYHQNAIEDYTQVLIIDPSSAKAYYNRGIAKMALSQADEALKDLEIASRLGFEQAGNIIRSYYHN